MNASVQRMNEMISANDPLLLTMSSVEIAELTNKEHRNVMRDIRNMLVELHGEEGVLKFEHTHINPQNNQQYPVFKLPKRETLILVSGYNVKLRARIIDRWQELESQQPAIDPMKALSDPTIMRGLLLTYTEKVITLENKVQEQAPKVNAFDRIAGADGLINLQAAGKILQQRPNKFIQKMREIRWIFKRPGAKYNSAYIDKINAGYLATKSREYERPDGTIHVGEQVMVTPKGLAKLALVFGVILDETGNNGDLSL